MPHRTSRAGAQHPDEWRYDLNPDALSGPDVGPPELQTETSAPTAYDVQEVHNKTHRFAGFPWEGHGVKPMPFVPPVVLIVIAASGGHGHLTVSP